MAIVVDEVLTITSPSFVHNGELPSRFTCDGANVNPALEILDLPDEVQSLVIIMDDPDAQGGIYNHWIMWNIPPNRKIEENTSSGIIGKNSRNENNYYGPCPPAGKTHHYTFRMYALNAKLSIPENSTKQELLKAIEGHIAATGEIAAKYGK